MLEFFNSIIDFLANSFVLVFNLIVWLFNLVIWLICGILNVLVIIFPNTPFDVSYLDFGISKYMGYLNYILPVKTLLSVTLAWGGCMFAYWAYGIILRYLKITD